MDPLCKGEPPVGALAVLGSPLFPSPSARGLSQPLGTSHLSDIDSLEFPQPFSTAVQRARVHSMGTALPFLVRLDSNVTFRTSVGISPVSVPSLLGIIIGRLRGSKEKVRNNTVTSVEGFRVWIGQRSSDSVYPDERTMRSNDLLSGFMAA